MSVSSSSVSCHAKRDDPNIQICKEVTITKYYDAESKSMVSVLMTNRKKKDMRENIQCLQAN